MINKQVKSSERERESNSYTRATAIDLKTIDSEVALLSGRATQTPIGMKELWDEVQNLKATAKSWEIVTLKLSGKVYPFDSKYASWNWIVLTGELEQRNSQNYFHCNRNYNSTHTQADNSTSFSWAKSGNTITTNVNSPGISITVLFYK